MWIGAGVLSAVIAVLLVALIARPPIVDDPRLRIPQTDASVVHAAFLGGTLTTGVFASAAEKGFRPLVVQGLGSGTTETRAGVDGGTIAEAIDAVEIPTDTNLVVIELGSGDVWVRTSEEVGELYARLIAKVREQAPQAALVCLGVWNEEQATSLYDDEIRVPCQRAGGLFLPLIEIFETPGMRSIVDQESYGGPADGFHPGDLGYAAIAELILGNLRTE